MDAIAIVVLGALLALAIALLTIALARTRLAAKRFEVLHQIADVSDRAIAMRETLDAICAIIVPELADFCMIDLVGGGRVERVAVRVGPGGGAGGRRGPRRAAPLAAGADGRAVGDGHARAALLRARCPRPTCATSPTTTARTSSSCAASAFARRSPSPCGRGEGDRER